MKILILLVLALCGLAISAPTCSYTTIDTKYVCLMSSSIAASTDTIGAPPSGKTTADVQRVTTLDTANKDLIKKVLETFENLEVLQIQKGNITSIDSTDFPTGKCAKLKQLQIWNGEISEIAASNIFAACSLLEEIDLTGNKLIKLETGSLPTTLKKIILASNSIVPSFTTSTLFGSTSALPALTHFSLSGNKISSVSNFNFPSEILTHLDFSNNLLTEFLSAPLQKATKLESFYLNENKLTAISDTLLSSLVELKELKLNSNSIASIHQDAFKLNTKLVSLDISVNPLTSINETLLKNLVTLTSLDIHDTKLETSSLASLTIIFEALINLQKLDISSNSIGAVDSLFSKNVNLLDLNINNIKLKQLKDTAFTTLTKLQNLTISGNEIDEFPSNLFEKTTELKRLILKENKFVTLNASAFTTLKNLEVLDFTSNKINKIEKTFFDQLTSLKEVRFASNECINEDFVPFTKDDATMAKFQKCFNNYNSARTIMFSNILLVLVVIASKLILIGLSIRIRTRKMKELQILSILLIYCGLTLSVPTCDYKIIENKYVCLMSESSSTEEIKVNHVGEKGDDDVYRVTTADEAIKSLISKVLKKYKNLAIFQIPEGKISSIVEADFETCPELVELQICNSDFESVPEKVFDGCKKLDSIDLTANKLSLALKGSFPDNIKSLILAKNAIKMDKAQSTLFNSSDNLKELSHLDLSGNNIESLSTSILPSQKLIHLDLSNNKLSEISDDYFNLNVDIQVLNLQTNKLTSISENIFKSLTKLKVLNIGNNNINMIKEQAFHEHKLMEHLDISSNPIVMLNAKLFQNLTALKILNLQDIKLNTSSLDPLKTTLLALTNLEKLDISKNNIGPVNELFTKNEKLTELNISSMNLSEFKADIFKALTKLQTLNFDDNKIVELPENIFEKTVEIKTLSAKSNKIAVLKASTFEKMVNLETLDFTGNEIDAIEGTFFDKLTKLKVVKFDGNKCLNMSFNDFKLDDEMRVKFYKCFENYNSASSIVISNILIALVAVINGGNIDADYSGGIGGSHFTTPRLQTDNDVVLLYANEAVKEFILKKIFDRFKNLEILEFRKGSLTRISSDFFYNCNRLETVLIKESVFTNVPENIFGNCSGVKNIDFGKTKTEMKAVTVLVLIVLIIVVEAQDPKCLFETDSDGLFTCKLTDPGLLSINADDTILGDPGTGKTFDNVERLYSLEATTHYMIFVIFKQIKNLKKLELAYGTVEELKSDTFYNCAKLEKIIINKGKIATIDVDIFSKCSELQDIDLSSNNITNIISGAFNGLQKLKTLKFNDNHLTNIQATVFNVPSLEYLDLSKNGLTFTNRSIFSNLNELLYLNLAETGIKFLIKEHFNGLGKLTDLDFTKNELNATQDTALDYLAALKVAKFKNNICINKDYTDYSKASFAGDFEVCIQNFNGASILMLSNFVLVVGLVFKLFNCEIFNVNITTKNQDLSINSKPQDNPDSVKRVYFAYGQIMRYVHPKIFQTFSYITTLILQNVLLFEIDGTSFFNCGELEYLDLSNNILEYVGNGVFVKCPKLKKIDLSYNRLDRIEEQAFINLSNLMELNLEENFLTIYQQPSYSWNLPRLEVLDLSDNYIITLSDNLIQRTSLKDLKLSDNRIIFIPRYFFQNLRTLIRLELDRNRLQFLYDCPFSYLINLEYLYLQYNLINHVHCSLFINMINLKELRLEGNFIFAMCPQTFMALKKLTFLDISSNIFSNVVCNPNIPLHDLNELQILDMSHNSIQFLGDGFGLSENSKVIELYLNHNKIYNIYPYLFEKLINLTILDLSYNRLITLSIDTFICNYNLKILRMSNNNFTRLDYEFFSNNFNLYLIDFSYNEIHEIDANLVASLRNMKYMNFTENYCVDKNIVRTGSSAVGDLNSTFGSCFQNYENRHPNEIQMPAIPTDIPLVSLSNLIESFVKVKLFVAFVIVLRSC
ncbi:uncharacterized protein [Chironomus tepperi]|uniref:uncharacterized protein n=1 Tax=Chironomus tepperi TaxID=113505 RepID=UPI00391F5076